MYVTETVPSLAPGHQFIREKAASKMDGWFNINLTPGLLGTDPSKAVALCNTSIKNPWLRKKTCYHVIIQTLGEKNGIQFLLNTLEQNVVTVERRNPINTLTLTALQRLIFSFCSSNYPAEFICKLSGFFTSTLHWWSLFLKRTISFSYCNY